MKADTHILYMCDGYNMDVIKERRIVSRRFVLIACVAMVTMLASVVTVVQTPWSNEICANL